MAEKQLYRLVKKGVITPQDFLMAEIFYNPGDETREHPQVTDEGQILARRQAIKDAVSKIGEVRSPQHAEILRLRFGLKDGTARSRGEVGEIVGLCQERVRQKEAAALRSLRHPRIARNLKSFLPDQTS